MLAALEDADSTALGRWGERLVHAYFASAAQSLGAQSFGSGGDCTWVNSDGERGLPFDLQLVPAPGEESIFIGAPPSGPCSAPWHFLLGPRKTCGRL